ncbi:DUF6088 family protein [Sphingomonas sp. Leaf205]|uniref:DUF6088 family protein n=1 Tax=Sphingomonas sp. Leaf205 TaxID=2876551 RepID=UPI001E53C453|nr:DUF6088 family protein [Sphingomonas sp. Leaf205]
MSTVVSDRILRRMRGHGRGRWVGTAKDFLDVGNRAAVDQALSRLARQGTIRRVARGMYDLPRHSTTLKRDVPVKVDAVVKAVARRDGIRIMPDNIVAANGLGLTNAVPSKNAYVTDGTARTIRAGKWDIRLKHADAKLMSFSGSPSAPAVQALHWLGRDVAADRATIDILRSRLGKDAKRDLARGMNRLPSWAAKVASQVVAAAS